MDKILNCPTIILCGGKSSRMQQDKSLLPFGGYDTLIEYQYKKYQDIFEEVYISAKENKLKRIIDSKYFIEDNSNEHSPMAALQTIFKQLKSEYAFIVAVDIPLIQTQTITTLYSQFQNNKVQIAIAKDKLGTRHNLCGFFHKSVLEVIDQLLLEDMHKIGILFEKVSHIEVVCEDSEQFINLNKQEDYKKACDVFI